MNTLDKELTVFLGHIVVVQCSLLMDLGDWNRYDIVKYHKQKAPNYEQMGWPFNAVSNTTLDINSTWTDVQKCYAEIAPDVLDLATHFDELEYILRELTESRTELAGFKIKREVYSDSLAAILAPPPAPAHVFENTTEEHEKEIAELEASFKETKELIYALFIKNRGFI